MKPRFFLPFAVLALASATFAQRPQGNPFAPPQATVHYALDRQYDLRHIAVDIAVDYKGRTIQGHAVNTVAPLRNGLTELTFMAGTGLDISAATLNGAKVEFRRDGRLVHVKASGLTKGKPVDVGFSYTSVNAQGRGFGAGGGWHWVQPLQQSNNRFNRPSEVPDSVRVGFWTQGESEYNSEWVPTWDYPNDLATSETRTTVPADWIVIGNGLLVGKTFDKAKGTATYDWKMTQPHATYLLSLCGGPFDVKKDTWQGVELWYVVPKGMGQYIDSTFANTKDMLTFFSQRLGFKYVWPKYAQNAMFDFGGGMENVSSTTLGEGALTEPRQGYFTADSVNSHELGHQWFGDTVTCKDWGDIWLNESFATFMQMIYFEHDRGSNAYLWEVEDNTREYLSEARRYKRPLSTKLYPNADAMFDSHTYPKGGVILHMLRKKLGDEPFYAGLKLYLDTWKHTPVQSSQLCRAMTEASGVNCEPFWKQWIESPGHPVLDYTWTAEGNKILLTVKQTQDTGDGTPIYDLPMKIGYVTEGLGPVGFRYAPVHITKQEETFEIPVENTPMCVVLDPDHEFLREIPALHWSRRELSFIIHSSVNPADRTEAMNRLLDEPTDADVQLVVRELREDKDMKQPAFRSVNKLAALQRADLRDFWIEQLGHANSDRKAQAVQALGRLTADSRTTQMLRALVNDKAPIQVVVNAIGALASWDKEGNADVFKRAQSISDRSGRIRRAANQALGE